MLKDNFPKRKKPLYTQIKEDLNQFYATALVKLQLFPKQMPAYSVGQDSQDGKFSGIPGFLGHFPEFPGNNGRESLDFQGISRKLDFFMIPVSREFSKELCIFET